MSFADKVKQYVENAPTAGFANVNYGALDFKVNIVSWIDKDGKRVPVRRSYSEDEELAKDENLEVAVVVKISELNPQLTFDYERNVRVVNSGNNIKTSWQEIVLPSLVSTFGDEWADVVLAPKKPIYVAVENVDALEPVKEGKRNYGVPKFIARFKNLQECKAARDERYGKPAEVIPADEEGESGGVPADVLAQARSLFSSVSENTKMFKTLLASKPFGEYEPKLIADAMGITLPAK